MWSSDPRRWSLLVVLLALVQLGCVETSLQDMAMPRRYPVPPQAPKVPPSEGAIWSGGTQGGSFLYFDRKARGVGDLVTVMVSENPSATGSASTELEHQTSYNATLLSDIGFTQLLQTGAAKLFGAIGINGAGGTAAAGESVEIIRGSGGSKFDGDGLTSRSGQFTAIVTCRVVDVLPGGVFHVFGQRQIAVNHDLQWITVEGLVRREDISIDNTVPSSVMADLRLTYDGIGVIDDKQRPPLISRLLNWVYPF